MSFPIPILMYHQIRDITAREYMSGIAVSTARFRNQMKALKFMGYRGLSMGELLPYLQGKKKGKVVGITFDDGYLNNLTNAMPVLQQHKFNATCYVVGGKIGKTNNWNPRLNQQALMSREEINEWIGAGMGIGSHSLNHVYLDQIDRKTAEHEIMNSKTELEQMFSVPVNHFCYPFGNYNDYTVKIAAKAGYHTATTTNRSRCMENENLLTLPRVVVSRRTLPHLFYMKVATKYEDKRRVA